jgi:anthranilate phosphoribosyltransferase
MIRDAIRKVVQAEDLSQEEAAAVMTEIMEGAATPAQIGCFLTALRLKGETIDEITGFAQVMREKATRIRCRRKDVVDTCGTGGDGLFTFNISTCAAFVAAGAGVPIAKHGNRSVSSGCGSADVLKELGANVEADPAVVERCLEDVGIGFLFAPKLHLAMKHAIGPRREIGIRTVFNVLGPLTNPAGAKRQLLGVYDGALTDTLARVLYNLGSKRVFVVHGEDGLDEISTTGRTHVTELSGSQIRVYTVHPKDFGLPVSSMEDLKGGDAATNAAMLREVLGGQKGPKRDIVLLNSAAVIVAGGKADDLKGGLELAEESIDSGRAMEKLDGLIEVSHSA